MRPKSKAKFPELREASKTFTTIESSHDSQLYKWGTKSVRTRHSAAVMKAKVLSCMGGMVRHGLAPGHWALL